jgi:glycerophosphoryl diester phosphodiesterase
MSFRPLLLGHRGAHAVRGLRENTIESFDRALADGCDGFEFDVRRTADGEAVIWHDAESDGKLIEEASADQLPQLARLEDVLSRYRDSAFLDIELKVAGLEKITSSLLRSYRVEKGFVLSSFLPDVLTALHSENANLPLGLICESRAELSRWRSLPIQYVIPRHDYLTKSLAEELRSADKKILVWTVNRADHMGCCWTLGVDGIISDETSLLCRTICGKPSPQGTRGNTEV